MEQEQEQEQDQKQGPEPEQEQEQEQELTSWFCGRARTHSGREGSGGSSVGEEVSVLSSSIFSPDVEDFSLLHRL